MKPTIPFYGVTIVDVEEINWFTNEACGKIMFYNYKKNKSLLTVLATNMSDAI